MTHRRATAEGVKWPRRLALAAQTFPPLSLPGTRQLTARPGPGGTTTAAGLAGRIGGQGVSRAHDIGGQTGFGPVPLGEDGLPFEHDWEARVAALNGVLRARGLYSGDEFRDAIERIPPQEYLGLSYYERWLRAIETLLAEKALLAGPSQLPDDAPLAGRGRSANREGG
jgi:nitrile hydratase subunit beta